MFYAMLGALVLLCLALVAEKWWLARCRRSFMTVIHVNGIRGKTTVCRMLDAVLRQRYAVLTKTTGTEPRVIHVDGRDLPLRRLGPANIHEQVRTLIRARRERAQVVILECMAVSPALQKVSEDALIHSDIAVITNVRYDHIFEMGETLSEIAAALAGVVPRNGTLYTADASFYPYFEEHCAEKGSQAVLCAGDDENEAIVRAIARSLDMPEDAIAQGLAQVQRDAGMQALYHAKNRAGESFDMLNLFAANDPQSALAQLAAYRGQYEDIRFVYNNRMDRPDRTLLFARHFFAQFPGARVMLLGASKPLAGRMFRKVGARVTMAHSWQACLDTPHGALLVGLGNTRGEARQLLAWLEKEAERA